MDFFFKVAAFCLLFSLVAIELRRNVKTKRERAWNLFSIFVITLIFSYLIDLTKWLLLMAHSFFTK